MTTMRFAENFYSFRITEHVIGSLNYPLLPDHAALAAIEAKLVEANNNFFARHYQDSIGAYNEAEALIFAQIHPAFSAGLINNHAVFPRDQALLNPLLSTALEWMNVLPAHQPISAVRPRVPVDSSQLGKVTELDQTGIHSSNLSSSVALNTVADWQLAKTFASQGNVKAAEFFTKRAQANDAATMKILEEGTAALVSSGSTTHEAPAGPIGVNPVAHEAIPLVAPHLVVSSVVPRISRLTEIAIAIPRVPLPPSLTIENRSFGTIFDNTLITFKWNTGDAPPLDQVKSAIYEKRISLTNLSAVSRVRLYIHPSDFALDLPHIYYYVIPLGLAECYHALGDYATAETNYFQAASYQYLNAPIEAPYLWQRLATLYLDWGNSLFRNEEVAEARDIYERVLMLDGSIPSSTLYTTTSLKPGADIARIIIANLDKLIANQVTAATLGINPISAAIIMEIHQQLLKIRGGLDFWGHWHNSVPIWTFDYLQGAAINFTQLAISVERDFINFQERADQAVLMRQQIIQNIAQANAEVNAAQLQASAASAEAAAYSDAVDLANKRAKDAEDNAKDYKDKSWMWIQNQALSAQLSGGDDGDANQLNANADALLGIGPQGERLSEGWRLEGSRAMLAAANQLAGSRLNREYELASLNRQTAEMNLAAKQAQSELDAANARVAAANAAVAVANLHATAAQQNLDAFNNQFFTPDVWYHMADAVWRLYQRYLTMAIRTARMMQQAYNFETDQSLRIIKSNYSTVEVKGLLGADALMADIQSFTYDLVTSKAGKPQPIRQTISLAERYPFAFENKFRKTGMLEFETRIDDFDAYYPGTYAGRIEGIEVEVIGIVPITGISGTLTNSGISGYRTPASLWTDPTKNGLKYRVQSKETLILSDYTVHQDALLIPSDQRMMRIFQGAGLASAWRLELPRAINDIDYGALTDVSITFYYKARFDPDLHDRVLAQLTSMPGVNVRQRGIPLRWVYPDAFFHFQDTGDLTINLRASDFRSNETKPILTNIGILIVTDGSVLASGLKIALSTPTHAAVTAQTDISGVIESSTVGSPWASIASGTALGSYNLSIKAADNPTLVKNGKFMLTPIVNIALILEYLFTPKT